MTLPICVWCGEPITPENSCPMLVGSAMEREWCCSCYHDVTDEP